jgi:hypothetical protein
MSRSALWTHRSRALAVTVVSAAFLWTLLLGVSPQLHSRIHADANRAEHSCAVTLVAAGSYDHAAHPPLISAPFPAPQFSKIPALIPCWVQSPFLGACIFEHAPPAHG